jgi:surface antigen
MIGIPANNKSSPDEIWEENFRVIKNTLNENYGKIIKDDLFNYYTEWKRLFDKNTTLQNPDLLEVGSELVVPLPDEVISPKELPEPPIRVVEAVVAKSPKKIATNTVTQTTQVQPRGSVSANGYVAGYCTWYVKNRRPDMPNNLGNASSWVSRAAAQGLPTGSSPRVGAVGQRGNHVVYVESVNDDGTVTISEMNHKGLYVQTTRTLPASYFSYIY